MIACKRLLGIKTHGWFGDRKSSWLVKAADWSSEEDDILLVEVFCVDLVGWGHAVAVAEAVDLRVWTRTQRLQMGLKLQGAGALRVGRDGVGLGLGLRLGLHRRHGGLLNVRRVGGADGGVGVRSSAVWRTELICGWHWGNGYVRTKARL